MNANDQGNKRPKLKPEMDLEDSISFEQMHKQAFRAAFDYLHACFPPSWDENYWNSCTERFKNIVESNKDNLLTEHLLCSVMNYLNDIVKDLPKEDAVQ